ncbi:WD repeat domain 53 [Seminavis robusta]|uniref:WD repeat domain 53 n=1 Tax=Seminavis robusta TaxID=568900 RepID=A0A9N8H3U9_9STRA|nr:WD repeat domain 53 [Seminavis robusta]|eukprot:Sro1_g000270.1 WD repeat domain 53 (442) ;mRNA; r:80361-81895
MTSSIPFVRLRGHLGSVLCLDHHDERSQESNFVGGCLLSGSEDGTARLWDLRQSKAVSCIKAGGNDDDEVSSVCFGVPPHKKEEESTGEDPSPFARNFTVYLSVGTKLLSFDLRKASSPIVPYEAGSLLLQASDDINQISVCEKRNTSYLASADDAGAVQVIENNNKNNNSQQKPSKKSKKNGATKKTSRTTTTRILQHSQDALVTAAVFRPGANSKTLELASGGTDCRVCLWDVQTPKRPLCEQAIGHDEQSDSNNQLCNPPMVHSLAWAPSGRLLAAGLGDGSALVMQVENRSLVHVARLRDKTDAAVAAVIFPATTDRLLTVIRNDAMMHFWDLGVTVAGEQAEDPSWIVPSNNNNNNHHTDSAKPKDTKNSLPQAMQDLSLDQPSLLFKIPHQNKPNWMVSSCSSATGHDNKDKNKDIPCSIFVADTTNDITAYTLR